MAKRGKTIYSITIIAIILISFFSMYFVYGLENNYTEFEKVASDYGKISVLNNHNTKLAEYVLLKNSDNCLTNCYAEGTANFYTSGYLFSDLKFKDSKGSLVNINSNKILIKVTEGYQVDVIEYEKVCDSAINGTVCYSEEIGSHKETRYRDVWQEYNNNLLQAGSYEWRIEGSKGPFDNIDWIGSSFGVEFNQWAWWNSNWENCKDLSIETSLNSNNWITELNITGITFVNTTELRIVDSSCGEGGNEVKNTVLQNGSNWAIITWLTNSSGSSLNYSIYYNNPTNPVKASSLELVDEFCEFTTSACGYSNISATTFSITGGILNMSGQGGLKASPIGIKNVLVRFFHNGSDADLASTGLTNTSDVNWDAGAKHENSLFQYSGAHAVLAGFNAPNSFGETTINSSMANQWIVSFMKILTGNTTIFSYNSSGSVGVATKNIAIDDDGGDVFLYLGIKNPVSTIHSWDYVRAYDSESYYVNTIDYSVTLGAEEEYNFAPTTPILLLPSNNSGYEIYSTITFVWENSTDINGDAITYDLEIYNESDMATSHLIHSNTSIAESSENTSINIKLSDYTTQDDDYYWRVLASDGEKNSSWSEIRHFQYANWTIIFNLTDSETGETIPENTVSISCDNGFSGTVKNPYTATDFGVGTFDCTFSDVNGYYSKEQSITADMDKTVQVPLSKSEALTAEEHTWLEELYDCIINGNCDAYDFWEGTWQRITKTDRAVVTQEDFISSTLNSTSNITLNYTIEVPYKEGYDNGEYLPLRLFFWFTNADKTECYNQDKRADSNRAEDPYCFPLVAETLGPNNGTATFTVDLKPGLSDGTYNITRAVEIDPLVDGEVMWTNYGQENIGQVEIEESNLEPTIEIKNKNTKSLFSGITGAVIGTSLFSGPGIFIVLIICITVIVAISITSRTIIRLKGNASKQIN